MSAQNYEHKKIDTEFMDFILENVHSQNLVGFLEIFINNEAVYI